MRLKGDVEIYQGLHPWLNYLRTFGAHESEGGAAAPGSTVGVRGNEGHGVATAHPNLTRSEPESAETRPVRRTRPTKKGCLISQAAFLHFQTNERLLKVFVRFDDIYQACGLDTIVENFILFQTEVVECLFRFVVAFVGVDTRYVCEYRDVDAAAKLG